MAAARSGQRLRHESISGDVGDVARPHTVWRRCREVSLQQIGRNRQVVFAVGGRDKLALSPGLDAVTVHEFSDSFFAYPNASCYQLFAHSWPTVFLLDFGVNGLDVNQQSFVADAFVRPRPTGLVRSLSSPVLEVNAIGALRAWQCNGDSNAVSLAQAPWRSKIVQYLC